MRTADDFDRYYATPDPWGVARATFRDKVLRRHLTRPTRNRSVLELGCGEGHLTRVVFRRARKWGVWGGDVAEGASWLAATLSSSVGGRGIGAQLLLE